MKPTVKILTSALVALLLLVASASPAAAQPVVEYYHLDALGSVRAVTDQNGTVIERHDYLPFGEEWTTQIYPTSLRFTGKERDAETDLDYFGARYYAQRSGRFSTVDPEMNSEKALTNPQRWNHYTYAGNNPIRFVDPDGADFKDFVNGLADAIRANFVFGAGRSGVGNTDFRTGQAVGDIASLAMSAYEFTVGTGAAGGGLVACATGVGCIGGAPVVVGGVVVATHGVGMGAAAGISLMSSASGGEGRSGGLSNTDARKQATDLGFKQTKDAPFDSHGKPVFKKGDFFITPDRDSHKGGVWKMFDRNGNRVGTYNADLTERIAK